MVQIFSNILNNAVVQGRIKISSAISQMSNANCSISLISPDFYADNLRMNSPVTSSHLTILANRNHSARATVVLFIRHDRSCIKREGFPRGSIKTLFARHFVGRSILSLRELSGIYGDACRTLEILQLSPQCSIMLLKCKLHGTVRNCSKLFAFRKTQDGYCCTFNYARERDDIPV